MFFTYLSFEVPDHDEGLAQHHEHVDQEDEVEGVDDKAVDVVADKENVDANHEDEPDEPVLGEEALEFLHAEVETADVGDHKGRVEKSVAENGSSEDEIGALELDDFVVGRHEPVVGREDDDEQVDTEENDHELAEDVNIEDFDVEEANWALGEGKDVVGRADGHDNVEGQKRQPDGLEEEDVRLYLTTQVLVDEINRDDEQENIPHLKQRLVLEKLIHFN